MYKPDNSQDSARFSIVPVSIAQFSLQKNRTQGELIPVLEGDFMRVERVDLPCRASFVTADGAQVISLTEGFEIASPFKQFTLIHDDYTLAQSNPFLSIMTGRGSMFANQLANPFANRLPLAYSQSSALGVGGRLTYTTMVPFNARRVRRARFSGLVTLTAALAADYFVQLGMQVYNASGPTVFMNGGLFTRTNPDGSLYSPATVSPQSDVVTPDMTLVGANVYRVSALFEDIPIPTGASVLNLTFVSGDNVSAVNAIGAAGTGLQAYFE